MGRACVATALCVARCRWVGLCAACMPPHRCCLPLRLYRVPECQGEEGCGTVDEAIPPCHESRQQAVDGHVLKKGIRLFVSMYQCFFLLQVVHLLVTPGSLALCNRVPTLSLSTPSRYTCAGHSSARAAVLDRGCGPSHAQAAGGLDVRGSSLAVPAARILHCRQECFAPSTHKPSYARVAPVTSRCMRCTHCSPPQKFLRQ